MAKRRAKVSKKRVAIASPTEWTAWDEMHLPGLTEVQKVILLAAVTHDEQSATPRIKRIADILLRTSIAARNLAFELRYVANRNQWPVDFGKHYVPVFEGFADLIEQWKPSSAAVNEAQTTGTTIQVEELHQAWERGDGHHETIQALMELEFKPSFVIFSSILTAANDAVSALALELRRAAEVFARIAERGVEARARRQRRGEDGVIPDLGARMLIAWARKNGSRWRELGKALVEAGFDSPAHDSWLSRAQRRGPCVVDTTDARVLAWATKLKDAEQQDRRSTK